MGVIQFIGSLPGKAARVVSGARKEVALRTRGTAYVTRGGQIRINTNPEPGVRALADDVFVAASNNRVGRALTNAATEMSHPPISPVTDDIGTDTAVRLGAKALGKVKQLLFGG